MQPRNPSSGQFTKSTNSTSYMRQFLSPIWAAGAAFAAANLAKLVSLMAPVPAFAVLVFAAVLAAVRLYAVSRQRDWTAGSLRSGLTGVVVAAAWSIVYVALPLDPWFIPLVTLGLVLMGLCGRPWWSARRLAYGRHDLKPQVPPPPPPQAETDELEEPEEGWEQRIAADWENYVANSGGALTGSQVRFAEQRQHTIAFDIDFSRGRQDLENALAARGKIASALGVNASKLLLEQHPENESASVARMTVITGAPLGDVVDYPGPQLNRDTGEVAIGPFADGEGICTWRAFTEDSFHGGIVTGAKGSGKSRTVDVIVHSLLADGRTVLWYGDPQKGASSPALAANADWVARDLKSIKQMLATAINVMEARAEENAVDELNGFTPSPARPALLVVIDENSDACLDKDILAAEKKLAEQGRKVGLGLLLISQQLDLTAYGGSESLRNNAAAGNLLAARTTTKLTKDLVGGLPPGFDPTILPAVPGYGMRGAPKTEDGRPTGRAAPYRAYHLGDDEKDASGKVVRNASMEWFNTISQSRRAKLDPSSVSAAGKPYADRHADQERDMEAMRKRVAARRAGLTVDGAQAPSAIQSGPAAGIGFTIPMWEGGTISVGSTEPVDPVSALDGAEKAAYHSLCTGCWRPADISAATGYSDTAVREALNALVDLKLAARASFGHYHATGREGSCRHVKCTTTDNAGATPQ